MTSDLTAATIDRIGALFQPDEASKAANILRSRLGALIAGYRVMSPNDIERLHFAALKISEGELGKLEQAVLLAEADWRDLLMAAGFARDTMAHHTWARGGG